MCMVDIQAGTVGEDDVGERRVFLVRQLAGIRVLPVDLEAARVAQRHLVLVVPAGPTGAWTPPAAIGIDDRSRQQHRMRGGVHAPVGPAGTTRTRCRCAMRVASRSTGSTRMPA